MDAVTRPTLFFLHALGMSAREWDRTVAALGDGWDCVALDLPGFGAASDDPRVGVEEMAEWLADGIRAHRPAAYLLVGHSMGGKIATIVAARALSGETGLSGLAGVVLLAASPPAPEPIDEPRRRDMIGWFANGAASAAQAAEFVEANIAGPLDPADREQAEADVRRSGRHAWLAWLERGSREDWASFVGELTVPALIVAGSEDGDLGEANQRHLNLPHYPGATVRVIDGAAHLLPYERPDAVAAAIVDCWSTAGERTLPARFAQVLASPRVSRRTRRAMLERLPVPTDRFLDEPQRATLAALVDAVLPGVGLDVAARVEAAWGRGEGDGWRFADLPPDRDAATGALAALAGFADLNEADRAARLDALASGRVAGGRWSGQRMQRWFEDLRAEAVRAWLSHPAAMARIGWDGFAIGGDGVRLQGFQRTAADDLDPWQPRATRS